MIKDQIKEILKKAVLEIAGIDVEPEVFRSADEKHGDYSTNVAMTTFKKASQVPRVSKVPRGEWRTPTELGRAIVDILNTKFLIHNTNIGRVDVIEPGFVNFWLSADYLITQLKEVLREGEKFGTTIKSLVSGKRIMVEFAHPNTHKEMHIGHMRTLITGESLARILESQGAKVFRANYQGDIGPHVAKAIYGIQKIMEEKNQTIEEVNKLSSSEKAHFLGDGYVRGNQDYEEHKEEIDRINAELYKLVENPKSEIRNSKSIRQAQDPEFIEGQILNSNDKNIKDLYLTTRQWSLDYYDEFYTRFYTKFNKLFFESEVSFCGKKIVLENVGKIFKKDEGAVVFKGEDYGLHTRVFVTKAGYPTYEGKDMCLAFKQYEAFPFDKNIHVVASEQAGYFKVIIKALELLDPSKFEDKEFHLSMGMVQLSDRKMSSRTGEVLTVDWLVDKVKEKVGELIKEGKISSEKQDEVAEQIAIGAIKYSVLKVGTGQNAVFDIEKSVSLEGNSGPYIQYTFARTQSVLGKVPRGVISSSLSLRAEGLNSFQDQNPTGAEMPKQVRHDRKGIETEELSLLRSISFSPEAVLEAGEKLSPNLLCNYLFELAQKFNLFYQKHKILESPQKEFRLALTAVTGQILKNGLYLLGIEAPERM